MASTVADVMLERLRGWGVDHVFGYAGDGINELITFAKPEEVAPAWTEPGRGGDS